MVQIIFIVILLRIKENETVQVHLGEIKPTFHVNDNCENNEEDILTIEVIGDMPKVIGFEQESTFQVIFDANFLQYNLLFSFINRANCIIILNSVNFINYF